MIPLCDITEKAKLSGERPDQWLSGAKGLVIRGQEKIWGVMELFYTYMVVVVTWLYAFVKIWRNVY